MTRGRARRLYLRAYCRDRYRRRRRVALLFLAMLAGSAGCVDCGEVEGPHDIDHEDPADKGGRPVQFLTWPIARLWAELRKCRRRCGPCHRRKTTGFDLQAIQEKIRAARRRRLAEGLTDAP